MTRRNFILTLFSLATAAQLKITYPFKLLSKIPTKDGVIIKNGWILKETDL